MFEQFFGKVFWITLGSLAATFLLAVMVFHTPFSGPVLFGFALLAFCLSLKRLEYGLCLAFAELFANSHGHLIFTSFLGVQVSLRMAIFCGVILAWVVWFIKGKGRGIAKDRRFFFFLPLILAVFLGFVIGFLTHPTRDVFLDGNAYFYLAYVFPILTVTANQITKRWYLQVLIASAVWVIVLTLGILFVFTHVPEWLLKETYVFIRDTRTGELTKMAGPLFRVFLQSQFSVIVAGFLFFIFALKKKTLTSKEWWLSVCGLGSVLVVVLLSLSRSFWLGILVSGAFFIALCLWKRVLPIKRFLTLATASTVFGLLLGFGVLFFPYPRPVTSVSHLGDLFSERSTDLSDVAISSRWNLLPPLIAKIWQAPVVGSGFGQTITFKTDDPRARSISPNGTWTTYALEWGWFELWLKMGLLGPAAFLWLIGSVVVSGFQQNMSQWLSFSIACALIFLSATHVFSPYLNHPLGIGLVLFFLLFLSSEKASLKKESVATATDPLRLIPATAPQCLNSHCKSLDHS